MRIIVSGDCDASGLCIVSPHYPQFVQVQSRCEYTPLTIALTDWLMPVVTEGNSFPLDVGVGMSVDEFNRLTIVASSLARCADGLR